VPGFDCGAGSAGIGLGAARQVAFGARGGSTARVVTADLALVLPPVLALVEGRDADPAQVAVRLIGARRVRLFLVHEHELRHLVEAPTPAAHRRQLVGIEHVHGLARAQVAALAVDGVQAVDRDHERDALVARVAHLDLVAGTLAGLDVPAIRPPRRLVERRLMLLDLDAHLQRTLLGTGARPDAVTEGQPEGSGLGGGGGLEADGHACREEHESAGTNPVRHALSNRRHAHGALPFPQSLLGRVKRYRLRDTARNTPKTGRALPERSARWDNPL
jgi:hypothetical protein